MSNAKHTPNRAVSALLAYQQADEEGVMVLVSRQAIHEVAEQHAERLDVLEKVIAKYDPESTFISLDPDPGCIVCTSGATPNKYNTGLCLLHKAQAIIAKARGEDQETCTQCKGTGKFMAHMPATGHSWEMKCDCDAVKSKGESQ